MAFYNDDVDFESFSFAEDPLSPVWATTPFDQYNGAVDSFWQNLSIQEPQQMYNPVNEPPVDNFHTIQQHQHHHHLPQTWESQPAATSYHSNDTFSQHTYTIHGSAQNSYDSSYSASTDSDVEFDDATQNTWDPQCQQQPQYQYSSADVEQYQPTQQNEYYYPTQDSYSEPSSDSWEQQEDGSNFMNDDENDPVDFKLPASKTPIMEAMVVCAINNWGISVVKSTPNDVVFKVLDFDRYYRISRAICSKHRPTEDIGSRVKSLRRWFTNFPKKKDRQENPQFFLSVKPNTCKKVHGLIDRNTKLLNAQRKAR